MNCEGVPGIPFLDKSWLFRPLSIDAENPNRSYLQCPATGHVYCTLTGSLYRTASQMHSQAANISSLDPRKDSRSFSSTPTPYKVRKPKNTDEPIQSSSASSSLSNDRNESPSVRNVDQSLQGNRAQITEDNKVPVVKNVDKHLKGTSITPSTGSNKTFTTNHGNNFLGSSASITPKSQLKTSINVKSGFDPTTKQPKKKRHKKKDTSVAAWEKVNTSSKKKSKKQSTNKTLKQQKVIVLQHFRQTKKRTFRLGPFFQTQSKTHNHSGYNPFVNSKKKSFRYHIINLQPMTTLARPIEVSLNRLLFPERSFRPISVKVPHKSHTRLRGFPSFKSINTCSPNPTEKPSLYFSREDHAIIALESSYRKKTTKRKASVKMSDSFNNIGKIGKPFNRRPHLHCRNRRLLLDQHKNCIMASSVHEIIHSRFAKNTNEHMPVSQIRAMLSSGDRKLRNRRRWIQQMEEEAIHKYKQINLKQNLQVEEYDVLHHPEKTWLVSYGRWVINRKDEKSWPLLVKCLHKYPDSTLRQACAHRSFCLRWDGTSYTLRTDHAYYTQIQCHMAVTDTCYAELIVHTHKETAILPVYFDSDFWKKTEEILEAFFTSNILPYLKKVQSHPTKKI